MLDPRLHRVKQLADTEPDEALRLCNAVLNEDFQNTVALFMSAYILMQSGKRGLAYNLYKRCAQVDNRSEVWNNMGMCLEFGYLDEALACFDKALSLEPDYPQALANKGLIQQRMGDPYSSIENCRKALEHDPELIGAHDNLAMSLWMTRQWPETWKEYKWGLGRSKERKKIDYGLPEWDGERPGTVVIHGEQGMGDEIMFASCVPDAQQRANVVLDVMPRLVGAFQRSFDCPVYGTRFEDEIDWLPGHSPDYQCALGDLPGFYRNDGDAFPALPYLTPDPERCLQWRALLDTYPGKKIGVAWNGGIGKTGRARRSVSLETLSPLFESGDTFISLEYDRPEGDIAPVIHWPRATERLADYDETLALINELDLVICVTTTVMHAAGGLGKDCWVLVPKAAPHVCHVDGDMPWYSTVRNFRQASSWGDLVSDVAEELKGWRKGA